MRLTIDLDDNDPLCEQLNLLCKRTQDAERAAQKRYAEIRGTSYAIEEPKVSTSEEVCRRALAAGVSHTLSDGRAPNTVLAVRRFDLDTQVFKAGQMYEVTIDLPIGAEILKMTALPSDGPNWDVTNLTFGTMNIVNPLGSAVPLSDLLYLTTDDLLNPFEGAWTKVCTNVVVALRCKKDGATFGGYKLFMRMEEQNCAIQTRISGVVREDDLVAMMKTRYRKIGDDPKVAWVVGYVTPTHFLLHPENQPDYYKAADTVLNDNTVLRVIKDPNGCVVARGVGEDIKCKLEGAFPNAVPRPDEKRWSSPVGPFRSAVMQINSAMFVPIDDSRPSGVEALLGTEHR